MKSEFSYNKPCHTQAGSGGEEIKPHGWDKLSPKETWQARQVDDQDRGGIPNPPQEVIKVKKSYRVVGEGRHSGKFERSFRGKDEAIGFARKCRAKAVNPSFAATIKVLERGGDVTVTPSGQVTVTRHGDRAYAPPGYLIRGRRGDLATNIGRTCAEAQWKQAGWALSLVAA